MEQFYSPVEDPASVIPDLYFFLLGLYHNPRMSHRAKLVLENLTGMIFKAGREKLESTTEAYQCEKTAMCLQNLAA